MHTHTYIYIYICASIVPYPKPSTLNANLTAGLLGPLLEETNGTILLELLAAAEDFGLPAGSFRHVRSCALYIYIYT